MKEQLASMDISNASRKVNPMTDKLVKSLAQSVFETLCNEGCQPKDIIGVSSQLLSLVTYELERDHNS
jgi:hypothetical protein